MQYHEITRFLWINYPYVKITSPQICTRDRKSNRFQLVDAFETEHFPIEAPDPIEAILFRMDQAGYERRDLQELLGKSRVSELLNRKRSLTLNMIRKLHEKWNISADVLIGKAV